MTREGVGISMSVRSRWWVLVPVMLVASAVQDGATVRAAGTATIYGTINLPASESATEVCIEPLGLTQVCRTGSGPYSMTVPVGRCFVHARPITPDSNAVPIWQDGGTTGDYSTPIELADGESRSLDFTLPVGGRLEISSSQLVSVDVVDLSQRLYRGIFFAGPATGFPAVVVPPGSYKVLLRPAGDNTSSAAVWAPSARSFSGGATYTVTAGQSVSIPVVQYSAPTVVPALRSADQGLATLNYWRSQVQLPALQLDTVFSELAQRHSEYFTATGVTGHNENWKADPLARVVGEIGGSGSAIAYNDPSQGAGVERLLFNAAYHAQFLLNGWDMRAGIGWSKSPSASQWALNVFMGNGGDVSPYTILWPPSGAVVPTNYQGGEEPDPLTRCPGYTLPAGLPVQVRVPWTGGSASAITSATLLGPTGPVESCLLNPTTSVFGWATLLPRHPLPNGTYAASFTIANVEYGWSFVVNASPVLNDNGALQPGVERRVHVADGARDVLLQLTTDRQVGPGWAAAYPCAAGYSGSSSNNFVTAVAMGVPVAVATDSFGDVCVRSNVVTDVVVDKLAELPIGALGLLTPIPRVYDSRN